MGNYSKVSPNNYASAIIMQLPKDDIQKNCETNENLTTIGGGASSSFPMTELNSSKLGVAAPLARTGLISTLIFRFDSSSKEQNIFEIILLFCVER